ncbi:MAG: CsbD family protein [Chloroflexota bacterium]|nr:MAG: CsbD family protein [Chloroflexota bacterium]
MAGEDNKAQGTVDQLKGKAQEGMGKVTGDEDQEAEGKATQTGGKAREGLGNLQDAASDLTGKD